jgi:hypothetical protein
MKRTIFLNAITVHFRKNSHQYGLTGKAYPYHYPPPLGFDMGRREHQRLPGLTIRDETCVNKYLIVYYEHHCVQFELHPQGLARQERICISHK